MQEEKKIEITIHYTIIKNNNGLNPRVPVFTTSHSGILLTLLCLHDYSYQLLRTKKMGETGETLTVC